MAGNDPSISDFLPSKNTQVYTNGTKNKETTGTIEGDQQEALPAPQPPSRKPTDGNGKKNTQSIFFPKMCLGLRSR